VTTASAARTCHACGGPLRYVEAEGGYWCSKCLVVREGPNASDLPALAPRRDGQRSRRDNRSRPTPSATAQASPAPSDIVTEPVDGAALLDEVAGFIRRYVLLTAEQVAALALWVTHTHAFPAAETTAYVHIKSAERQSGKTKTLETLEPIVARPWFTSRASVAALVRKMEELPSLLLDEMDRNFEREKEYAAALLQILNDGYRKGKKATLCVSTGKGQQVVEFPVFCPKAFTGLGSLPDTIEDRSVAIVMKRRGPGETVSRFRFREVRELAQPIRERLSAWANAQLTELGAARPDLPDELSDRQQDCWEPLLAIADLAGGEWPRRARRAAISLSLRDEDQSLKVRLLDNIRTVFVEHGDPERLMTATLLSDLNTREEWSWGEVDHGKPLTSHRLAAMVKPFGIGPGLKREGDVVSRGYARHDFADAWSRHLLPRPTPQESVTAVTSVTEGQSELNLKGVDVTDVTDFQGIPPEEENRKKEKAEWTC